MAHVKEPLYKNAAQLQPPAAAEERQKMLRALQEALVLHYNGHGTKAVEAALRRGGRPVNLQDMEALWNIGMPA